MASKYEKFLSPFLGQYPIRSSASWAIDSEPIRARGIIVKELTCVTNISWCRYHETLRLHSMPKLDSCISFKAFGTSSDKTAQVRQLECHRAAKYFCQASTRLSKVIPSNTKKTNPWARSKCTFFCFPVTSELILHTTLSSMTSLDSPPDFFPFADLFSSCFFF